MSEAATEVPFGDLGEVWWRDAAAGIKATEQQMTFAVCRYAGMTRTAAARRAGYSSEEGRDRKRGSEAAKGAKVQMLLALAVAEAKTRNLPTVPKTLMTREESLERLTEIARGPDKSLALRALEAINKASEKESDEAGFFTLTDVDGLNDYRVVRDALLMANGAISISAIFDGGGRVLADMPLMHDVVEQLRREDEAFYQRLRRSQGATAQALLDQRLADPDWQRETRLKIWREKGMTLDDVKARANGGYLLGGIQRSMNGASHEQAAGA